MYASVRCYTGGDRLADALVQRRPEVEELLRGVPGFPAYYAVQATDGAVATITVCDDRAGTSESSRRAAASVRENLSGVSMSPPEITEGETILNF